MNETVVAAKCQQLINENSVTIFSKTTCPFCTRVKLLFKSLNITPAVYELDRESDGEKVQEYLYELTKQRTVPNVFVQAKHVGGCDDTMKAYGNGKLQLLLKGAPAKTPEDKVQNLLQEHSVVIFSKSTCHNSAKVKALFKNMGVKAKMFHLDKEPDGLLIQEYLHDTTKHKSTPNVFVRGKNIGGIDDTSKAFGEGLIKRLLSMPNLASEKKFNDLIKSNSIMIFAKTTVDSYKVKDIFHRLGVKPVVFSVDEEPDGDEIEGVLNQKSSRGSLPTTFVNGINMGGYDEVKEVYENGKLSKLVHGPELNEVDTSNYDFDLLVVGGGSGGLAAAKEASSLGKKVGLCDFVKPTPIGTTWGLGGTCVNVGCIPKKLMHQASLHSENYRDAVSFGWAFPMSEGEHAWEVMVENVQNYIKSLNFGYRKELNKRKVKYYNAFAEFVTPNRLKLTNKKGDVSELTAKDIIIAVGGRPAYPDIPGAKEYCITSDDLFSLPKPPGKTLIVGASYIALECGGFLRGLGYDVTIMVRSILLRGFDRQIADLIGEHMEKFGVKFVKGYEPVGVGKTEGGKLKVAAKSKTGEEITVTGFDTVVLAIGREACTSKLGLENLPNLKINPKNKKIIVDDYERSSVPNIYAIGDVIDGKPELTPVAIHAGKYLAQRLAGVHNKKTNYKQVPTTVFTPLEYGCVGLSEEEAYEIFGQENIIVYHNAFKPLEHSLSRDETLGYAKLICVKSLDELVVGFHVLSPNAGEITQGFAIGLKLNAKKSDFDDLIGIHPTCAEIFTTLSTVKNPGDKPPETTEKRDDTDEKGKEGDRLSFSLSEEEAEDTTDSLDIKPPQAVTHRKPRHKREKIPYRESKRSHGHKELSSHRKSHHQSNSDRRRQHKEGDRVRDKESVHSREKDHREKRLSHRERRLQREKSEQEHSREMRLTREQYYRNDKSDERLNQERISIRDLALEDPQKADQILQDLRGKLIDKRNIREGKSYSSEKYDEPERKKMKRDRREMEVMNESPLNETPKERAERLEREERKAKLLEADREMAKRKEVSRRELEARRERHNIEKEKDRMLKEIAKKHKLDDRREKFESRTHNVVVVSDNSEGDESQESAASTVSSDSDSDDDDDDDDDDDEDDNDDEDDDGDIDERTENSENEETDDEELMNEKTPESVPPLEKSPVQSDVEMDEERGSEEEPEKVPEENTENNEKSLNESPKSNEVKEDDLPPYLPAIQGCRSVEEFQCLNRIEEGTYGVVYRARDKRTNDIVALKRLKMEKEKDGFPITSLREINTLLKAQHPNIVTVREIVVGSNMDKIFIVMDYVEHDLKSLMETMKQKKQVFVAGEVKCLMQQLLKAVAHLHDNWILHRDLKTSNLLLSHKGVLKVGDFGLAREYGSPLKIYTPIVVTLWYRAPELLLQSKEYSTAIDMWSVGCIFGELLQMKALFAGETEMSQLNKIFKALGTPNEKIWPGYSKLPATQKVTFAEFPVSHLRNRFGTILSELGIDLINKFLTYDPVQRITADDALKHDYFKEAPLPIDPAMFPTWPAKSEQGHKKVNNSPKPPSGGKEYKQLGDTDEDVSARGFHMGVVERRVNAIGPGFSLKF